VSDNEVVHETSRRPIVTIAIGVALAAGGCGREEAQPASTTARPPGAAEEVNPLPSDFAPLKGGTTYRTRNFQPAVEITPPKRGRWSTDLGDTPEHFSVKPDDPLAQGTPVLAVHRITRVYDPKTGGVEPGDMVPFSGDFAAWLAGHPHLRTTKPERVQLLGRSGVQVDVTTRSSPPRLPRDCGHVGDDCVPLFYDGLDQIVYGERVKGRFIVVPLDDGGQLVVEEFVEPAAKFRRALATLRPALESLELAP
jgi:hypothetical protein